MNYEQETYEDSLASDGRLRAERNFWNEFSSGIETYLV
jgi:hypothetical protein